MLVNFIRKTNTVLYLTLYLWFIHLILTFESMKNDKTFSTQTGVTVLTVCAFLVLATLKLGGFVSWSWWVIASPLWIAFVLTCIAVAFVILMTRHNGN